MRFLPLAALSAGLLAAGIFASTASADSVVYAKDGHLFLTSPDGAKGYQLTTGGGYSSPSQADDGTIGAIRNKQLVRMDRSGKPLNDPVDAIGSPGTTPGLAGPYEARISPDGKRFAYWFFVQTSYHAPYRDPNVVVLSTGSQTAWTWADRFTNPEEESEYQKSMTQAEWVSNDRLLGTEGFWMNMWTWKLGTGHGFTGDSAQFWFGLRDPLDEWGVEAYHWYDDPALSHDGAKLAMTDGGRRLMIAATHGPAWSGEPPYEIDYLYGETPLAAPTLQCGGEDTPTTNPSWSSDGELLAYGAEDGVRVMAVPDSLECSAMTERTVAPGGTEPAFGPADVDMADAPVPGRVADHGSGPAPAAVVRRVSLRPLSFRAGSRRARVRFTLSASAPVKLTVRTGAGRRVRGALTIRGRQGANVARFRGRIGGRALKPGRYRLELAPARGRAASTGFRIVR